MKDANAKDLYFKCGKGGYWTKECRKKPKISFQETLQGEENMVDIERKI